MPVYGAADVWDVRIFQFALQNQSGAVELRLGDEEYPRLQAKRAPLRGVEPKVCVVSTFGKSSSCGLFRLAMATLMHENGAAISYIQQVPNPEGLRLHIMPRTRVAQIHMSVIRRTANLPSVFRRCRSPTPPPALSPQPAEVPAAPATPRKSLARNHRGSALHSPSGRAPS